MTTFAINKERRFRQRGAICTTSLAPDDSGARIDFSTRPFHRFRETTSHHGV